MSAFSFQRKPRCEYEAQLLQKSKNYLACGVRNATITPDYEMVVQKAHGARLYDVSGNEYIDYLLGSGPMFFGHAHPAVVKAVQQQVENGSCYLMVSEPAILLAEEIVKAVPCAEKVSLHCSGSEATFFALRLARAYRKRDKILKFEGGYHGMGDSVLMSNQWTFQPKDFPQAVMNSAGIPASAADEVLIAPFNDLDKTASILRRHADELGAVIVEPLCRTIPPRPGFLEGLRELTRELDIPLIFDEVVTGFRLAFGGAQEYYGVTPDLCALGKTISGGHPLGVVCGRSDIMDFAAPERILTGDHVRLTGTFSSNPISCAVALALIEELKSPGLYQAVAAKGLRLKTALSQSLAASEIEACVIGEPTVFQPWFTSVEVVDHRTANTLDWMKSIKFINLLLDRGVVKAHEKFFVSTAHTDDDIDYTVQAVSEAVEDLKRVL